MIHIAACLLFLLFLLVLGHSLQGCLLLPPLADHGSAPHSRSVDCLCFHCLRRLLKLFICHSCCELILNLFLFFLFLLKFLFLWVLLLIFIFIFLLILFFLLLFFLLFFFFLFLLLLLLLFFLLLVYLLILFLRVFVLDYLFFLFFNF